MSQNLKSQYSSHFGQVDIARVRTNWNTVLVQCRHNCVFQFNIVGVEVEDITHNLSQTFIRILLSCDINNINQSEYSTV